MIIGLITIVSDIKKLSLQAYAYNLGLFSNLGVFWGPGFIEDPVCRPRPTASHRRRRWGQGDQCKKK